MAFDPSYTPIRTGGLINVSGAPFGPSTAVLSTTGVRLAKDAYYGGLHKVVGTVKYKNTPTNTPLKRKVFLLREPDMRIIAATWSDATTGAYSFSNIDGGYTYTVLSVDYTHSYRAVIADNLAPEAM